MKKRFEIEQKYRIANPALMRRRILGAGAKKIAGGHEKNELFDFKNYLRRRRAILRLRQSSAGDFLTFKGPCLKAAFKKRVEVETRVDYAGLKAVLESAGFRVAARYRKKREAFRLGSAHITLDYLSGFGWFVEIEASPRKIISIQKK